jgi:hypothetical protein
VSGRQRTWLAPRGKEGPSCGKSHAFGQAQAGLSNCVSALGRARECGRFQSPLARNASSERTPAPRRRVSQIIRQTRVRHGSLDLHGVRRAAERFACFLVCVVVVVVLVVVYITGGDENRVNYFCACSPSSRCVWVWLSGCLRRALWSLGSLIFQSQRKSIVKET